MSEKSVSSPTANMLVHTKLKSSTHRNQESDHLPAWCLIYWSPLGWKAEWQTITDWTRVFLKTRCFLQFQPLNLTACSQRRTWSWFIYSTSTGFTTGGRLTLSENTSKRCKWKKQIFFTRKHPVSFYTQSCCVRMCVCVGAQPQVFVVSSSRITEVFVYGCI